MLVNYENKKAGFWIRFASLIIDLIIFCSISISSSLMCIDKVDFIELNTSIFQVNRIYYIWIVLMIILISIQFIAIPLFFNGKTIGMFILGLNLHFNDKKIFSSIMKRIELGPLLWIIIFIIFFSFIWPSTINKLIVNAYINDNYKVQNDLSVEVKQLLQDNKLSTLENAFYAIPSTMSPIVVMLQLFLLISTGFKGTKISLLDKFSNSQIVYKNKLIVNEVKNIEIIKPEKNINCNIIWKN